MQVGCAGWCRGVHAEASCCSRFACCACSRAARRHDRTQQHAAPHVHPHASLVHRPRIPHPHPPTLVIGGRPRRPCGPSCPLGRRTHPPPPPSCGEARRRRKALPAQVVHLWRQDATCVHAQDPPPRRRQRSKTPLLLSQEPPTAAVRRGGRAPWPRAALAAARLPAVLILVLVLRRGAPLRCPCAFALGGPLHCIHMLALHTCIRCIERAAAMQPCTARDERL